MKESKERERALQAELDESKRLCRDKDLYISVLEGELQAKRKKISTLSGQLVEKEIELENLLQKSKNASCMLYLLNFFLFSNLSSFSHYKI